MQTNTFLPWYINIFFLIICFVTILWQVYYCQLLLSIHITNKWKTYTTEGIIITVPMIIIYLVGNNYSYVYLLFFLPFIWWRIWNNIQYFRQNYYNEINYNTFKMAWDSLPIPVAIANERKEIILINEPMYQFMLTFLKRKYRNIQRLWDSLENPDSEAFRVNKEQGHLIIELPQGESYWAEMEYFELDKENYMQLTLTSISKQQIGESLPLLLSNEGCGLQQLLINLEEIKRQEVAEEIHGRLHDFMGQRIAILQRLLSEKDNADYSKLVPMLENVLQDMRTAALQTPEEQLQNIITSFHTMGLDLRLTGKLPERLDWAQCFVNMVREGATNAVRHGEATIVEVTIEQQNLGAQISIVSNGSIPVSIEKGKGLQGIEKALKSLGGTLEIILNEDFILRGRVGLNINETADC